MMKRGNCHENSNKIVPAAVSTFPGPVHGVELIVMGLLDKIQNMFADKRTDLAERFEIVREAVHGTMSNFPMAIDRHDKRTIGLTILDSETTAVFEARFQGLAKPWEGQIAIQLQHQRSGEQTGATPAPDRPQ